MDSKISASAAINTNKTDEVLSVSPSPTKTRSTAEQKCLDDENGIEKKYQLLNNNNINNNGLTLILNKNNIHDINEKENSLISDNGMIEKKIGYENQEKSNNLTINHTPLIPITSTISTLNSCQPNPIYNEFVNQNYQASSSNNTNINNENKMTSNVKDQEDEDEDIKPLLKSIVKSPSGNLRQSLQFNGTVKTKCKRLSWQASTNPARYPINNPLISQEGGNTQSTSLDSSDDQATGQNEESPSSPIISSSSSSSSTSSSSDDDEFSEFIHEVPDGGYGWLIVFVSFLINMIADGITFSFGVFNVEFLKYFGDSKGKTAWISSIFMAVPLLSGPISSYLTDRYGCRKVTIVGAATSCIGFLLSAVSNSMEMLFITFGIIAGFGLSLCYVAAVVIVAYYFDKRRSFATGISVCGSGIGTFLFPPLIQYLITHYGWRGCTVLLAGILLNMCVCGALMRVKF